MIDLSTTTARALRHLVTIGMTQSTVEKYSYSGFGYIVRHFEEIGISYVTPDILDSFLLEQDRLFELGELSYRQISLIRRSCDLLKYCSENNITNFTPSTPWMRTVCRPWQSITKTPPTSEQISDPGNVYTLAWKVNNAIMSFGYSKATCMHYRLEGIEAILNDFYLEGLSHFSVDFLNRIVEEKRVQYVQGLVCASTYHCFRKVAIWMQEMHETGSITTTKVPNWGLRELSETYLSVFKYFFSDPELIERLAESSLKTARYAIRKFLFELEDKGYTSLSDINRNNVNTCITLLAKKYTSGLSTVIYFLRVFLRFLHRHELTTEDLSTTLPVILSPRKMFHEGFTKGEMELLLNQPDINNPLGKRDYAMMILAIQSGLRACDIVRIELSNIDWRASEIRIVQHKTGHPLVLPLEAASGNAIADYILHGRPNVAIPYLFLCHTGPIRPLSPAAASGVVSRYMKRVGISGGRRAFHSLRRTFGTRLLQSETSMELIQQLLGQKNLNSMKPYLSIDEQGLKQCALPLITRRKVVD